MKSTKNLLIAISLVVFMMLSPSCMHSTDNVEVDGNNITLLIDRPSIGVIGVNEWHWPNLDEAISDLYSRFSRYDFISTEYSEYYINMRFRYKTHDQYGNEEYVYESAYPLVTVPNGEIEKYKNEKIMSEALGLESKIMDVYNQTTTRIQF